MASFLSDVKPVGQYNLSPDTETAEAWLNSPAPDFDADHGR